MRHFLSDVARQSIFSQCQLLLINPLNPEMDQEKEIIDEFASFFSSNVWYIPVTKSLTIYETWNMGVELANSSLLTNWNLDDRRVFNSLDLQAREFDDPSVDVVYGPTLTTSVENETVEYSLSRECFGCYPVTHQTLLQNNSPHCLPMWRKSLHDRVGLFDTRYQICSDYDFWFRVLKAGGKFKMIPSLIGSYYRNPLGASSNPENMSKALGEVADIRERYKNG